MKKYLQILRACPLFEGIEDGEILRMLSCLGATTASFERKMSIIDEGEPLNSIGILLSGSANVVGIDYDGNRSIISNIDPSGLFVEDYACAGVCAMPVSVIANDGCEVMMIDRDHLLHTCQNSCPFHQRLIFNLMRDLANKALLFHGKIDILSKRTTRERLLTYLSLVAGEKGKREFDIPFDRQELADYLEVDRSGLSVEIGKLKGEGIIDCNKKHFVLC